jgi:hypothetical protein
MSTQTIKKSIELRRGSYTASFLPENGMNLASFTHNDVEVIDQTTQNLFDERCAGLGALIGPHFHRRNPATLPQLADESAFPHIARIRANGVADPFSHGVARYAPWTFESSENQIKACLSGQDTWNGTSLSDIEGQNFKMALSARMEEDGLHLNYSVVSDSDSLVGLHYYYRVPAGPATVTADVQPTYTDQGKFHPIPEDWNYADHQITFDLSNEADYGFHPYQNPLAAQVTLKTSEYNLITRYRCANDENSWQLFRPAGASYVCIEPLSATNPRKPRLSVSSLDIHLQIS